jgi:hypothetical protein
MLETVPTEIITTQVIIKKVECPPAQVRFCARLAQEMQVKPGEKVRLQVGQMKKQVHVFTSDAAAEESPRGTREPMLAHLALNPKDLTALGLTAGQSVRLRAEPHGLRLGPVVGILAPRRAGLAKPYQAQTSLFKRMIQAARELGVVLYIFDFHAINWKKDQVRGYTYQGERWISRLYPLPDVVFDRATGSFPGGSGAADAARRKLTQKYGIPIFNTKLGNKLRMHKLLQADPRLRPHLPPTRRVSNDAVVAGILAHHQGAYLKPQNGAQGKGIIRLRKEAKGVQYTLTTDSYQRLKGRAATVTGALAQLRSRERLVGYLVQPELHLIRLQGRICDVRVLIQRDDTGEWQVTGVAVRAGQPGSVISNIHGGGKAHKLEDVLKKTLGDNVDSQCMIDAVKTLALYVGDVLSRSTRCLGELGVDLGIDTKGRIWIIEANSRTGRAVFRRAGLKESASLADRRPLLFAQYLAGF